MVLKISLRDLKKSRQELLRMCLCSRQKQKPFYKRCCFIQAENNSTLIFSFYREECDEVVDFLAWSANELRVLTPLKHEDFSKYKDLKQIIEDKFSICFYFSESIHTAYRCFYQGTTGFITHKIESSFCVKSCDLSTLLISKGEFHLKDYESVWADNLISQTGIDQVKTAAHEMLYDLLTTKADIIAGKSIRLYSHVVSCDPKSATLSVGLKTFLKDSATKVFKQSTVFDRDGVNIIQVNMFNPMFNQVISDFTLAFTWDIPNDPFKIVESLEQFV